MSSRFTIGLTCSRGIGPERGGRSVNEDNYLVCDRGVVRHLEDGRDALAYLGGEGLLVAVADGMGGHEYGAMASQAAVKALAELYWGPLPAHPELAMLNHVLRCHENLQRQFRAEGQGNSGTTLTAAWALGARLAWVHVGDSRLYMLRGATLRRFTVDHNRGEFATRLGRGPPRDPHYLVQNFIFGSRGLGDDASIRLDPGTDSGIADLRPGDRLLLCTDGVSAFVGEGEIRDVLYHLPEPPAAAARLGELAMMSGSDDNVTALVVRVDALAEPPVRRREPD